MAVLLPLVASCDSPPVMPAGFLRATTAPTSEPADTQPVATQPSPLELLRRTPVPLYAALLSGGMEHFSIELAEGDTWLSQRNVVRRSETLRLKLAGTLSRQDGNAPAGRTTLRLTLEQIRVSIHADDLAEPLTYDSQAEPAPRSRLGQFLGAFLGIPLTIRVSPQGRLERFDGLDALRRRASLLVLPRELRPVDVLFRDVAFERLLVEALFLPLPTRAILPDDAWAVTLQAMLPVGIDVVTQLEGRLNDVRFDEYDRPVASTTITSRIVDGRGPGRVTSGRYRAEQTIRWTVPAIEQRLERDFEIALPSGDEATRYTQSRVIRSRREPR